MADRNPLDGLPAEAKARLRKVPQPTWVAPMLATLTDERFSREGWLFEPKWDGERCLAFRHGRDLNLVAQIGFTEWTPGGKLRHPRFLGLREDKRPEDVVREA